MTRPTSAPKGSRWSWPMYRTCRDFVVGERFGFGAVWIHYEDSPGTSTTVSEESIVTYAEPRE